MADLDIHYDPITVNNNPATVTIHGLDNIKETITLQTPQPVKSETTLKFPDTIRTEVKAELAITQPIRTEAKAELDIKPLEVDQCLTIRIAPLPPTRVRQPYQQHFGVTLFGVEWLGYNLEGELQTIVSDLQVPPQVAWGGEQPVHHHAVSQRSVQTAEEAGLHIRFGR